VLATVPHGVLFFAPSYSLISKLLQRWEATGMTKKMKELKEVFIGTCNSTFAENRELESLVLDFLD
jgi:Rad3-related DNA helicase